MSLLTRIGRRAWHEGIRARGEVMKWMAFLRSSHALKQNEFIIYNAAGWHFGWDYERRQRTYVAAVRPIPVVFLDLNSPAMTRFAGRLLSRPGNGNISPLGASAFFRVRVDEMFRKRSKFPSDSHGYRADVLKQIGRTATPGHAERSMALLRSGACRGLVISQEGLDDWPWALMAAESGITVYEPEGPLGSTCRERFSLDADVLRIRSVASDWLTNLAHRAEAERALSLRTYGNYEASAIARYMISQTPGTRPYEEEVQGEYRAGPREQTQGSDFSAVFFLHALGDAANSQRYTYSASAPLDYFEMTLAALEAFESQRVPLGIKRHPMAFAYPGDAAALKSIDRLVRSSRFLRWEPQSTNVAEMTQRRRPVVISGRGSVLVEAAFCRIPALALIDCAIVRLGMAKLVPEVLDLPRAAREYAFSGIAAPEEVADSAVAFEAFLQARESTQFFRLSNYNRVSDRNHGVSTFVRVQD